MLGSDEGTELGYTDGKVLRIIFGNVYVITFGIDVGSEMVSVDGSFGGSNDGKLEGLLF